MRAVSNDRSSHYNRSERFHLNTHSELADTKRDPVGFHTVKIAIVENAPLLLRSITPQTLILY